MLLYLTIRSGDPSSSHVYGRCYAAAVRMAREQVAILISSPTWTSCPPVPWGDYTPSENAPAVRRTGCVINLRQSERCWSARTVRTTNRETLLVL